MENEFNGNSKKMSRKDTVESLVNEEDLKNKGFKDIFCSLLLLEPGGGSIKARATSMADLTGFEAFFEPDYKERVEEINATLWVKSRSKDW
ncbi:hypothetical protein V6N11_019026 [Hibiscus sabdariffa]|uniref:Uncharacterized protein n=1 Tax=Hibiscus sabdariffa TaxID=183260 RepID=A0ABR2R132_9ROSI